MKRILGGIVVIALCTYWLCSLVGLWGTLSEQKQELAELELEYAAQKSEIAELKALLNADTDAQIIEKHLQENENVGLVWITNPTYEGVVSDIKSISKVCKKYGIPLIVDEAHGCLWNFNKNLPETALKLGADAVVHSLHKTGGAMTQSSMLHLGKDSKFEIEKFIF